MDIVSSKHDSTFVFLWVLSQLRMLRVAIAHSNREVYGCLFDLTFASNICPGRTSRLTVSFCVPKFFLPFRDLLVSSSLVALAQECGPIRSGASISILFLRHLPPFHLHFLCLLFKRDGWLHRLMRRAAPRNLASGR